jgi:hypothetical protein
MAFSCTHLRKNSFPLKKVPIPSESQTPNPRMGRIKGRGPFSRRYLVVTAPLDYKEEEFVVGTILEL